MKIYNGTYLVRDKENPEIHHRVNLATSASQVTFKDGTNLQEEFNKVLNLIGEIGTGEGSGGGAVLVVNTIEDRDSLTDLIIGSIVYVLDASGDPDIIEGHAKYIYLGEESGFVNLSNGNGEVPQAILDDIENLKKQIVVINENEPFPTNQPVGGILIVLEEDSEE